MAQPPGSRLATRRASSHDSHRAERKRGRRYLSRTERSIGRPARRLRRVPRPEHALGPVASTLFLLVAWAAVAHASGSGWVQAVGAVVAALLLLGLAAPSAAAARLAIVCTSSPSDAVAGDPVVLEIVSSRALRCSPLSPSGPPMLVSAGVPAEITATPELHGLCSTVTVRLGSAAPIGLLWWSRDQVVTVPRTVHVSPRLGTPHVAVALSRAAEEGASVRAPDQSGDPKGVRPYEHSDGRRRIHWRASAHTGALMVREAEAARDDPVLVVADLGPEPIAGEAAAEDALATVVDQLARGRQVVLETTELAGTVRAPVHDRLSAGRRLARAVCRTEAS